MSLSDKIESEHEGFEGIIEVKNVKEFIINETTLLLMLKNKKITWEKFWEKKEKLAGPKLT
jgi:hypothetical protein